MRSQNNALTRRNTGANSETVGMSDVQIFEAAEPILKDTIVGARHKDWALFSKHMPIEDSSSPEIRADVEKQWDEDEYLTAFTDNAEFLGDSEGRCFLVLWRLKKYRVRGRVFGETIS